MSANSPDLSPTKRALLAIKQLQAKLDALERANREPIAIVDMSCRFLGGADSPAAAAIAKSKGCDRAQAEALVIAVVEAKNENIMSGLGQCIAEMVAVQLFNKQEGTEVTNTYGVVTSGIGWKFLKLENSRVYIDLRDYSIESEPRKIIGILAAMVSQLA